jgi:hypothetical protein
MVTAYNADGTEMDKPEKVKLEEGKTLLVELPTPIFAADENKGSRILIISAEGPEVSMRLSGPYALSEVKESIRCSGGSDGLKISFHELTRPLDFVT